MDQQMNRDQQIGLEQEPTSVEYVQISPDQITPAGNEACLRQHQRHLRTTHRSWDLSEVSSHTDHSDFPGSRHSSLNTEPLTLDAEQMHDAKDQAADVIENVNPEAAFEIFTKDLQLSNVEPPSTGSEAEALADQINTLVENAQQVVEANEQQVGRKFPQAISASLGDEKKGPEDSAALLEDMKTKAG